MLNSSYEIMPLIQNLKLYIFNQLHIFSKIYIYLFTACTSTLCDSIIQSDFGSSNLSGFNRTFIWKNKANSQKQFWINFAKKGLRQIAPSKRCPDKHTYTLQAEGNVLLGKYCLFGTISSATILGAGSFSLDLPAGQELNRRQFLVSVGEEIKSKS